MRKRITILMNHILTDFFFGVNMKEKWIDCEEFKNKFLENSNYLCVELFNFEPEKKIKGDIEDLIYTNLSKYTVRIIEMLKYVPNLQLLTVSGLIRGWIIRQKTSTSRRRTKITFARRTMRVQYPISLWLVIPLDQIRSTEIYLNNYVPKDNIEFDIKNKILEEIDRFVKSIVS